MYVILCSSSRLSGSELMPCINIDKPLVVYSNVSNDNHNDGAYRYYMAKSLAFHDPPPPPPPKKKNDFKVALVSCDKEDLTFRLMY